MIMDSPIMQEVIAVMTAKRVHRAIIYVMEKRFGTIPDDLRVLVSSVTDDDLLDELVICIGSCPDLDTFRQQFSLLTGQ